jgi:acetyltransferase-like isoleucine patch superfamily enzyme
VRERLKALARAVASAIVMPRYLFFLCAARLLGRDRALQGAIQRLARLPGLRGEYLRRAFLARVLRACHPTATICYGTVLSRCDASIGARVYVGPGCYLGLVQLEPDVLLASGVHVPSGGETHGSTRTDIPIREQAGRLRRIRIGEGSWIGSAAIIMADVGAGCIVGAGSVVTKPLPDFVVAAGVPARVIRSRRSPDREERQDQRAGSHQPRDCQCRLGTE